MKSEDMTPIFLVASFSPTNNYLPVNLGQLKNVAQPFYDRFWALTLTNCYPSDAGRPYPWSNSTNAANDYAPANIGQAKWVFSFNTAVDSDGDGIPDVAERDIGSNPYLSDANLVNTNTWGQGLTNRDLYASLHSLLGIPNAWAIYTNTSQVAVTADIRSTNSLVTVKAAEFFLDSTNHVTFGAGTALSAVDGTFDSSNEMAQAIFTPPFPAGERHIFYIHAQGSNNRWCPFVAVILNPTMDDVLNRIQANYSAIHDLQYNIAITQTVNGVVCSTQSAIEYTKGPYKNRMNLADGNVTVRNGCQTWWHDASMTAGGDFTDTVVGDNVLQGDRLSDFFWDVPLAKIRNVGSLQQGQSNAIFNCALTPAAGVNWIAETFKTDFTKGFVTQLSIADTTSSNATTSVVVDYLNPVEVAPGCWIFSEHRTTISFASGDTLCEDAYLTIIRANQGLSDSLFYIPTDE